VRHIRRDGLDSLKKDKKLSEDLRISLEADVQKLTDSFVKKIDEMCIVKEKELMTV
jgi:ribosome recycling factor